MAYSLPVFNLVGRSWDPGHTPAADPPDFVGLPLQLYVNARAAFDVQPSSPNLWVPPIFIRVPLPTLAYQKGSIVESVTGSADYYLVRWLQNTHQGFPNMYLSLLCEQCTAAGVTPR